MTNSVSTIKYAFSSMIVGLFTLSVFAIAPVAHAADLPEFEYFGGGYATDPGFEFYPNDVVEFYPNDVVEFYPNDVVEFYPNEMYVSDYDPTYFGGYTSGGYMTGGYFGGGFIGGGVLTGGGYMAGTRTTPSNSVSNTCTAINSCNSTTVIDDHSVVNAQTTITTYTPPSYNPPVCSGCGCYGSYCPPPVYNTPPVIYSNPPIAYNSTPYVSLSAIPYTGLELGFWGTIAYWGFLVLWCLVAAYLIVVKKVQNRILRSLNNFLFGTVSYESASASNLVYSAPAHTAPTSVFTQADLAALAQMIRGAVAPEASASVQPSYAAPAVSQSDEIDSFVMSQVNRKRS